MNLNERADQLLAEVGDLVAGALPAAWPDVHEASVLTDALRGITTASLALRRLEGGYEAVDVPKPGGGTHRIFRRRPRGGGGSA